MKWNRVDEKDPKHFQKVIVYDEVSDEMSSGIFVDLSLPHHLALEPQFRGREDSVYIIGDHLSIPPDMQVTHWMRYPDPPVKSEEGS